MTISFSVILLHAVTYCSISGCVAELRLNDIIVSFHPFMNVLTDLFITESDCTRAHRIWCLSRRALHDFLLLLDAWIIVSSLVC